VLDPSEQAALSCAVDIPPRASAIDAATWSWKGVREWAEQQYAKHLSPRSCLRYLRRLGFVWKRPKRLLLKADAAKRTAFVDLYRALLADATARGARIFFVDEAHFRADGDLRGLWVRRGAEALVPSTSPGNGAKASYYAGVCLETGEVCAAQLEGTSTAQTSVAFLQALREEFPGEVIVIWDNGPAHHGPALRAYLQTPDLHLRLIALPAYSPDYNPAEELWKWIREDVTANTCFGTGAKVAAAVWEFLLGLNTRLDEVKQRCQNELQTAAFPERARYPERRLRRLEQRRQRTVQAALAM
jgi:transposase